MYLSIDDRPEMFPLCHYEWTKLYSVFVKKHGGRTAMQNYVLRRCLRNRQALEEHYRLSLHTSRRQKWYQYLEDRDVGNREALRALTEHMPKVTYVYMLHKVWSILSFRHTFSNNKIDTPILKMNTFRQAKMNRQPTCFA